MGAEVVVEDSVGVNVSVYEVGLSGRGARGGGGGDGGGDGDVDDVLAAGETQETEVSLVGQGLSGQFPPLAEGRAPRSSVKPRNR